MHTRARRERIFTARQRGETETDGSLGRQTSLTRSGAPYGRRQQREPEEERSRAQRGSGAAHLAAAARRPPTPAAHHARRGGEGQGAPVRVSSCGQALLANLFLTNGHILLLPLCFLALRSLTSAKAAAGGATPQSTARASSAPPRGTRR